MALLKSLKSPPSGKSIKTWKCLESNDKPPYSVIIVWSAFERSRSHHTVFHTDVNPLAGVMCVFKFGLASQVGVPFPPHTVVRVHRSGDAHVSWVFFIFSSRSETSPNPLNPHLPFTPDCQQSLLSSQPLPVFSGSPMLVVKYVFIFWYLRRETWREGKDLKDFHVLNIQRKEILALPCRANQI